MHPPRVTDAEVRATIRKLTVDSTLPSGAAVRAALQTRFKSRGGVARIYRLLADERSRLTPPPAPGSVDALQCEVQALRAKLARAEEREDAHQMRWAAEIDQLRMKLAALEPFAQQGRATHASDELLRRQLQAAERRAAALEQQLYELTRREGQGSAGLSEACPQSASPV
jgi:hypothetical protein